MSDVEMFSHQDAFGGHVAGVRPKTDASTERRELLQQLAEKHNKVVHLEAELDAIKHIRGAVPRVWEEKQTALEAQVQELRRIVLDLTEQQTRSQFVIQEPRSIDNTWLPPEGVEWSLFSVACATVLAFAAGCILGGWIL